MARDRGGKGRRRAVLIGAGAAAAAGVAALVAERAFVRRDRARFDPDATEPFGNVRGTPIPGVVSADGTPLHVEEWGSGPTIVFAHGYCLNLTLWHYQILDLALDYHVVAYDQRGHGRSGRPSTPRRWALDALAEDLDAVVRAAGEPAVVVGHSMGGMAALAYCRDFPEAIGTRVAGLVLADTTAADVMDGVVPGMGRYIEATFQGVQEAFMRALAGNVRHLDSARTRIKNLAYVGTRLLGFGPNPSPSKVAFVERVLAEAPTDVFLSLFPTVTSLDVSEFLANIDVPTLVLVGSHDRLTPPGAAKRIADSIKDADIYVVPGGGHTAMLEKPLEFNARLREFLVTIPGWAAVPLAH